jgi:transcriptional regulator with XRE-family HTH domain
VEAVTGKRPGRLQKIAFDASPINASVVDVEARIGWLLAMSRLHHTDPQWRDGKVFVEALADAGMPASRSLVSRWESGEIPVSYEAMAAYERVLGIPTGQISSITAYVSASLPRVKTRLVRPKLDPTSGEFADRLDDLIERCEDGAALATDWHDLGWHLSAVPLAHLRARTWRTLCTRLVTDLPRTVKLAYRQYSVAAFNLAQVQRAHAYLVDAIADYVADPDVQVITNPVGLLDRIPTREAARLVLGLVEKSPNEAAFRVGVWVATTKLTHGDFSREELDQLDMLILHAWRRDPVKAGEELAELIAVLPEGMRSTLVQAATRAGRRKLGYVVEHGEEIVAGRAREFSQVVADKARTLAPQEASYDEDRMLPRMVREAMFHRDSERRHLAALLIASSPFARAVTDCLLVFLGDPEQSQWTRSRMATLVRYLSDETHRLRMVGMINDPVEDVRVTIVQGLGHMPLSPTSDQALRASLGRDWSMSERAKMYALGMSGSPALPTLAASAQAPEWQRSAARWWHRQGPALFV